jgi:hypothetical protein
MRRQDYFAEAIKVGRIVRGLSVRELSEGTGIPTWLLRAYESGKSQVRPETFVVIWKYLSSGEPVEGSPARGAILQEPGLVSAMKSEGP